MSAHGPRSRSTGSQVSAPEGELLVHAAARHGVFIPTLCHDDKLDPYGGCRMCVVGVEGSPRPLPACATRVAEGMVVSTNSSVPQFRKTLTEMLLAEHLNPNPGGRPNELVDLAEELDAEAPFILPDAQARALRRPQQAHGLRPRRVHPLHPLRPLHAGGHAVLGALARGPRAAGARSSPTHGYSWLDTECELCGGCLSVCPTGAIYEKFEEGTERPERAAREGQVDLHVLRRRLPDRPQRRPGDEPDREGHLRAELRLERGQPLRQGPLRLQLRPPPGPADRAARPRRGRRAPPDDLGARATRSPPTASSA